MECSSIHCLVVALLEKTIMQHSAFYQDPWDPKTLLGIEQEKRTHSLKINLHSSVPLLKHPICNLSLGKPKSSKALGESAPNW